MCVQQRCDLCAAQRDPGWSIWVWDDDGSARTRIVCDADVQRCVEWHRVCLNAEQPAVGGVEAVCDIGKQKRRVLLQQSGKRMRKDLVRAVTDKDLLRSDTVIAGQGAPQISCFRVRVKA